MQYLFVGAAVLAAFSLTGFPTPTALSESCQTAPLVNDEKVECLNACASGCQTLVPIPFPPGPLGATYTYCYCVSDGSQEPRCCHVVRVWISGTFYVAQRGVCGGDNCPAGQCSVRTKSVGTPPEAVSVGECITPP